jgi:hypothetical protein
MQIVSRDSATLPGYPSVGLHAIHTEMTKYRSRDDANYLRVCDELRSWVRMIETRLGE